MSVKIESVLEGLKHDFIKKGLDSNWYKTSCNQIQNLTDFYKSDLYTLEAELGKYKNYKVYAVVQLFDQNYPNLAFVYSIMRNQKGFVSSSKPTYTIKVDKNFSTIVLPKLYDCFNYLDPKSKNKSLLIQSYSANLSLADLLLSSVYSLKLLNFKKFGQLAQIAVDYGHIFLKLISKALSLFRFINKDLYYLPKTKVKSDIPFVLLNPNGEIYILDTNSTALNEGLEISYKYMTTY